MAAYWSDVDPHELMATWETQLRKFDAATVKAALDSCADGVINQKGGAWPPTLPEFVALCKANRIAPEHRPALPPPGRTETQIKEGREQMQKITAMLATTGWAK